MSAEIEERVGNLLSISHDTVDAGLPLQHFVILPNYDDKYESVRTLSLFSSTGHGMNIIAGVNLALESIARPVLVISLTIAFLLSGLVALQD
ncbi:hypothetical protein T459_03739 [Capsicum annuum]|uniref:Uncharacterized protein n=1 Tax=Capsicum annuum TaxID=4072 RepID=A0A2G3ANP1_CAPAN|nr:hypothetical protein T459_03739 [Capsicum annuum]